MPLDATPAAQLSAPHRAATQLAAPLRNAPQRTASPEAAALAFADTLDALRFYDDEAVEDALLRVGELLGGLSCGGFRADLTAHLASVEQDLIEDAHPSDVSRGMGGNDPDSFISGRLEDAIAQARATDAQDWLDEAGELLNRALLRESVA